VDVAQRGEHMVAFYESDNFLTALVADFLAPAVRGGGHALAIATGPHRGGVTHALLGELDAVGTASLVMYDAAQTLSSLRVGGALDPVRFRTVVSGLLASLAADGKLVRIFGEMVALLYQDGEPAEALALEDMWNDLASSYEFDLLCAYPMRDFDSIESTGEFQHVCGRHTAVANQGYAGLGIDARHPHLLVLDRRVDADAD